MSNTRLLRTVTFAILGAGSLLTLGFIIWDGEPRDPDWWVGVVTFGFWSLIPYALLGTLTHFFRGSTKSLVALLAGSAIIGFFALYVLVVAFVISPDAQSALVFLFLPFWQLVFSSPFSLVALLLRRQTSAGSCPNCGYSLKGLEAATNCPECGCHIQRSVGAG